VGALYMLTFPSGKSYIGVTSWTTAERFAEHCARARRTRRRHAVHSAIRKYGPAAVETRTLVIADDRDFLHDMEIRAIAAYETKAQKGLNLTAGGEGIRDLCAESREKRRSAMFGRAVSAETREKLRLAATAQMARPGMKELIGSHAKGRVTSAETRMKLRATSTRALASKEVRERISAGTRAALSRPSVREKLSASSVRKWSSPNARAHQSAAMRRIWAARRSGQRPMIRLRQSKKVLECKQVLGGTGLTSAGVPAAAA